MFKEKGQTTIEYILFLLVIVVVFSSFYSLVKDKVLGDKGNCQASSTSLICQFEKLYSLQGTNKGNSYQRFRSFRIIR